MQDEGRGWRGWLVVVSAVGLAAAGLAAAADGKPHAGVPWPATDGLGRVLPLAAEVGAPRADRWVGIFYFLWHGSYGSRGPYDVSRILAANPDALHKPEAGWGPSGHPHYWGEPLFGYYRGDDPWVLRKHAQMLADAGVDTLIFDTTNAAIYRDIYRKLCEVFAQARREGVRTPGIAFMVNTEAGRTAQQLYEDLYKPGDFRDLWFIWQGKPLLICDPAAASPEVRACFTLRRAHWPFEMVNTQNAWHWEAAYPQPYGYTDDPNRPEQVNVSVAQNLRASDGKVTNMSDGNARGRGFHDGQADASPAALDRGLNAAEQWRRALALAPPFVMVTGWNEWIAGRFDRNGRMTFVDQYNRECSRDIEPMRGGHGDAYYYQLVDGIRRYKGAAAIPAVPAHTVAWDGPLATWAAVAPVFADTVGDALPRAHAGVGGAGLYTDASARNDIVEARLAHDATHVWFHVRARAPLTAATNADWMVLYVDADTNAATGWLGYDYAVNRTRQGARTSIERHAAGGWQPVAQGAWRAEGAELALAVPRAAVGVDRRDATFDFKWADHCFQAGDWTDFTLRGDAAPNDRFRFRAHLQAAPPARR